MAALDQNALFRVFRHSGSSRRNLPFRGSEADCAVGRQFQSLGASNPKPTTGYAAKATTLHRPRVIPTSLVNRRKSYSPTADQFRS